VPSAHCLQVRELLLDAHELLQAAGVFALALDL
jgi:hypothetical protein